MKKWISRYTETVSFWIMLAALLCFGLAFFVSTWKNPTPPYHLLILLFLPAVLYGILTWMEIRWKYGSVAAGIGGILAIPILLTCFFFWIGIGLVSQSSENPAYYPRVYRFHRDLPGMEYFPAEIPEDAEDVVFRYSNIIFAPGRDRAKHIQLTCSGLELSDISAQFSGIAVRVESAAYVTEYVLYDAAWKREDWKEEKDVYCSVTVNTYKGTVMYHIRIEI